MTSKPDKPRHEDEKSPRGGIDQEQFLMILTREEAIAAFESALRPAPLGRERVDLAHLVGRVLAEDIRAPIDAPPFDRSVVDGFAVRAADLATASGASPVDLALNAETIACGISPRLPVRSGTATPIATGAPLPRGADAVVMIEHTETDAQGALTVSKSLSPGQNIAFAGSDIARGQVMLYRNTIIGSREIAVFAAVGIAEVRVWRKPRVAVISTGDELVAPGTALPPAGIYDSNGPIVAAALDENGCIAVRLGVIPDDEALLEAALRKAMTGCDAVILSGGTSKGAGDLTQKVVGRLGSPGIVAHGVALKPGKPLCLAVCDGKPVVILPGFPTSAMFTFHDIVAPFLRMLAGLPAREDRDVQARIPVTIASDLGRTEFVMVALSGSADAPVAHPVGKGSGAVTAFSQADGFIRIDALSDAMPAGTLTPVRLFAPHLKMPGLVIMGSHCVGLDAVVGQLAGGRVAARVLAIGSLGGLGALKRGECDIAPIHLVAPETGRYNTPFLDAGMRLIPGWRRLQGIVHRAGDARFEGRTPEAAVAAALADPECILVNRNQGAGTRTLVEQILHGARPPGYWNQPRSHNAVAVAVQQGRADWGVAIRPVAEALGLGFIPLADEYYDFAVSDAPRDPAALAAFEAALMASSEALAALGFARSR